MTPAPANAEDPRVTVVVMSRNRRDELLTSLPRHRAPVILVDNGSTDGTVDAVRSALPHVEVVALARNLGAAARTVGVRHARTPYVAFADDDSWWAPGSLAGAAELLDAHPSVAVVAARILVGPQERLDPLRAAMAASPLTAPEQLPGPRVLGFVACAAVVRREPFLAVGGFDDVVRFPGEEERLAWDLTAAGHHLVYADHLVVHHHPSPSRHGPGRRRRAITRAALLTGVMRLPWRAVQHRVAAALRGDRATRLAVLDALREMPSALGMRRRLPAHVHADLEALDRHPAGAARPPSGGAR